MNKRRTFTAEFKARVVLSVISGEKSAADVCREHGLKPPLFARWKADFLANAARVFQSVDETADPEQARIAELERLVGRQALELEVLKKVSSILDSAAPRNARS